MKSTIGLLASAVLLTSCGSEEPAFNNVDEILNHPLFDTTSSQTSEYTPKEERVNIEFDTLIYESDTILYQIDDAGPADELIIDVDGVFPQLNSEMELSYLNGIMQEVMWKHALATIICYNDWKVAELMEQADVLSEEEQQAIESGFLGQFQIEAKP